MADSSTSMAEAVVLKMPHFISFLLDQLICLLIPHSEITIRYMSMVKQHENYNLRRSTSCVLAPGKVTVMVVGALMSYFLCGVRQTRSCTRRAYTELAM